MNRYIKDDEIMFITSFLNTGMNINGCINLLINNNNQKIFEDVKEKLNQGYKIEEAISKYLNKDIKKYFDGLIQKTSFKNALELAIKFKDEIKTESSLIIKNCLYPFILLFLSLTALYFFDLYGLDNIFNLLRDFNTDTRSLIIIRKIIHVVIYMFYYGILLVVSFVYYMSRNKRIILLYKMINKIKKENLFKSFYTCQFVSLLKILRNDGYSFKESLLILRSLKNIPIVSIMAYRLDDSFCDGNEIKEALDDECFDNLLKGIVNISGYVDDFDEILDKYIVLNKAITIKKMKRLSLILETLIYLFIGLVVVFVYQILFMPLKAIGGI